MTARDRKRPASKFARRGHVRRRPAHLRLAQWRRRGTRTTFAAAAGAFAPPAPIWAHDGLRLPRQGPERRQSWTGLPSSTFQRVALRAGAAPRRPACRRRSRRSRTRASAARRRSPCSRRSSRERSASSPPAPLLNSPSVGPRRCFDVAREHPPHRVASSRPAPRRRTRRSRPCPDRPSVVVVGSCTVSTVVGCALFRRRSRRARARTTSTSAARASCPACLVQLRVDRPRGLRRDARHALRAPPGSPRAAARPSRSAAAAPGGAPGRSPGGRRRSSRAPASRGAAGGSRARSGAPRRGSAAGAAAPAESRGEHDRVGAARDEDSSSFFASEMTATRGRSYACIADERRRELALAAVDHDQVRHRRERLVVLRAGHVAQAREPPRDDLGDRREVVRARSSARTPNFR